MILKDIPLRRKTYDVDVIIRDSSLLICFVYNNTKFVKEIDIDPEFIKELDDEDIIIANSKLVARIQSIMKDMIYKYNKERDIKKRRNKL